MKIYFVASISGKKIYTENYKKIVKELEHLGHKVISDHILGVNSLDLNRESPEDRIKHNKQLNKWLSSIDVVVAEVSYPSVSVGYELAIALEKGKPVLALHVAEKTPVALVGEPSDRFMMEPYTLDDISRDLKLLLEQLADQMDVRFNFFVSPKIVSYLDWIAKKRRMPRAVYLRRLIEDDMKKNRDYEKE